jgi:PmbA protein
MNYLDRYRHALRTLPEGVSEAEVDAERRVSTMVKCSGGEIVETGSSDTTELFVRASGDKTGYAYTQDLEEEPEGVFTKALRNSSQVELTQRDRLNGAFVRRASPDGIANSDIQSMKKIAGELENVVRDADRYISSVTVEIRAEGFSRSVINSRGLDVETSMSLYSATASVMAEKNGLQYNASCYSSAKEPDHLVLEGFKERIAADLSHQYEATEIGSGSTESCSTAPLSRIY